jgi:hypothetical protein
METGTDNRLTAISPNNHQPWLWFIHFFTLSYVSLAAGMRVWMKWRQPGWSDATLLASHVSDIGTAAKIFRADRFSSQLLYITYWVIIVLALINGLGKADSITNILQETKAAKVSQDRVTSTAGLDR